VPDAVRELLASAAAGLAVVELASASGLQLVPPAQRDPLSSSSIGTGQLLLAAAGAADAVLLGVGGSATCDLGLGALEALGVRCLSVTGEPLVQIVPARWFEVAGFDSSRRATLPPLFIARDVDSPLLGERGAAATYAPQKGLPSAELPQLEAASEHMANLLLDHFGSPRGLVHVAGMGAAGGVPFALRVAYGAQGVPGSELVGAWLELDAAISTADLVITGEGRFDASSLRGKAPGYVVERCRSLGKRCLVVAGSVEPSTLLALSTDALTEAIAISPATLDARRALLETEARLQRSLGGWFDAQVLP
jgi:glycerate kinase